MKFLKLILLVIAVQFGTNLYGQPLTLSPTTVCPDEQTEFVVHFEADAVLSPTFIILAPGVDADWSLFSVAGASCATLFAESVANNQTEDIGGNVRATFVNGNNPQIRITSANGLPLTEGEYRLAVRLNITTGGTLVRNFRFIVRKPLDLVFALDRSGSMECDTDEDVPATWMDCVTMDEDGDPTSGDGRRWDILTASIDNFITSIDPRHSINADRVSVVYFDGNTATAGRPLQSFDDFVGTAAMPGIVSDLVDMADGVPLGRNGTSIGAGLVEAFNGRLGGAANAARRQIVVLFTDGEQNTGNWLTTTGPQTGRTVKTSSAAGATNVLDFDGGALSGIQLYTVGVISPGTTPAVLSEAASDSDFFHNVVAGEEASFGSILSGDVFNAVFSTTSPRFIDKRQYKLNRSSGDATADFVVNRNVNRLLFQAFFSSPVARKSTLSVFKDGVPVPVRKETNSNDYSINIVLPLYARPELTSEGTWTVKLTPTRGAAAANTEVTIMGTADDHAIRFDAGTAEDQLVVGKPFRPTLALFEEGQAVNNATVTATISKPGDDIGDLLARTEVQQLPKGHKESASCADLKYGVLRRNNPAALTNLFRATRSKVTLKQTGNGRYEGLYSQADVTGVYKIRYEISYTSPGLGEVRRMVDQTRYVNFPQPDLNLVVKEVKGERLQGSNNITVVTPSYRINGKKRLVGPGYAPAFGVSNQAVRLSVSDNCNGSYQLRVSGLPNERFTLHLLKEEVFEGTVKTFNAGGKPAGKGYLVLSGGRSLPQGDFARRYNEGLYGQVGLGRRFGSRLGVELVGGYYGFEQDFRIIGGTAYLNAYLGSSGAANIMVGAGPGYYFPEGGDARLGGSIRAALERQFGRLSLGVEGGYFRLTDPEIDFATLGLRATIGL